MPTRLPANREAVIRRPFHRAKQFSKVLRYRRRRRLAAARWGPGRLASMPRVFGNAMPKSGSHLLHQVLLALTGLGPFVDPGMPPVNRGAGNAKLPQQDVLSALRAMQPGEIRYGYLHARDPWLSALTEAGRATVFVYRDPRDWVISQIFYATEMHPGHMLHDHYLSLPNMGARINAAITGVDSPQVRAPALVERYQHYLAWLETPGILCLRFEDLALQREAAFRELLDYLHSFGFEPEGEPAQALQALVAASARRKSGTFRKGQPDERRLHLSEENKSCFKQATGNLIARLGYEPAEDW